MVSKMVVMILIYLVERDCFVVLTHRLMRAFVSFVGKWTRSTRPFVRRKFTRTSGGSGSGSGSGVADRERIISMII